jgi:hypothetical protein
MLDADIVNRLVQDEIKKNVNAQVDTALSSSEWLQDLESRIVSHVQDRITARFSNISTVPDLVSTVSSSVEKMFKDGLVPSIDHLVDNTLLEQAVDQAVENLVTNTVENLMFNESWMVKIQSQISREISDRISRTIKQENIKDVLREVVIENAGTLTEDLNRELTVEDGLVVVKSHLNAESASIDQGLAVNGPASFSNSVTVDGDLAIKGRINTNNRSFQELAEVIEQNAYSKLKDEFLELASDTIIDRVQKGIDIKAINVRGKPMVHEGTLSDGITESSLTSVGTLEKLQVGTYLSAYNHRVGINTVTPTSALSVWDNEVSIEIGKHSQNTAQIGTAKAHSLSLLTNNQQQLTINADGLTWVKELQVGRNKIATAGSTPGHSGAKGDIVFNSNYKQGEPFAWACLGAYRWAELKSA